MAFFEKWGRREHQPEQEENPSAKLAALKKRKEELEPFVGTDAWTVADRTLLEKLTNEIAELEAGTDNEKKAA